MSGRGSGRKGADGFTDKERAYIAEIQIDWNGTQAAIRAGYSPKSAADIAYELNRKPHIVEAIQEAMAKRAERAKVNADWVLIRLVALEARVARQGKKASPLAHLRVLETIGKHVDVNAFRTQFGIGNPDGTPLDSQWDFTLLDPEEFQTLARLLRKCAIGGGSGTDEPRGELAGPPAAEPDREGGGEASA